MTIASVAFVVLVYLGVLSLAGGLSAAFSASGDPSHVVVLREGALSETSSFFTLERGREVMTIPGIAVAEDGTALAAGEVIILNNLPRRDGSVSNVTFRGVAPESFRLRPEVRVVDGRCPDLRQGSEVPIGQLVFRVVGIFDAGGSSFGSEVWGAAEDLSGAFRRGGYYSAVLLRATSPADAEAMVGRVERLVNQPPRQANQGPGCSILVGLRSLNNH